MWNCTHIWLYPNVDTDEDFLTLTRHPKNHGTSYQTRFAVATGSVPEKGDVVQDDQSTLARGVEMMAAFLEKGREIKLADLSREMGLTSSTAHRLAAVLLQHGMISRQGAGRYGPGLRLASLMSGVNAQNVLSAAARPLMDAAARRFGMTLHLGCFDGEMVTYLVKSVGRSPARAAAFTKEGMQLEAYCSGVGRVLLAAQSREVQSRYLGEDELVALTSRTLTDRNALLKLLDKIATQGFACDDREISDDLHCLAVPVRDSSGEVLAAVSVSTDWPTVSTRSDEDIIEILQTLSAGISRNLGFPVQQKAG